MGFKIVDYEKEMDSKLLELFYRSIFYKKKEFEYVRVPNSWIFRYHRSKNFITKVVVHDNEIIASLGIIEGLGKVDKKTVKVGYFVDNCILPNYRDRYDEIFSALFKEVENDAEEQEINVICGWDFQKNVHAYKKIYEKLGFTWVGGVNWYPGGFDFRGEYPFVWKGNIGMQWKILFTFITYYHTIKEKLLSPLVEGVEIRNIKDSDFEEIFELMNLTYRDAEFAPVYNLSEFKDLFKRNNIHGIVAEKNSKIIGVLTYITSAWSGWMFGKPFYKENWQTFFTFTPDEFAVIEEFQDTSVPAYMILQLLKLKNPEKQTFRRNSYGFIADVFDSRMTWRRNALLRCGCMEPKADHGAILAKSLNENIKLNPDKIWHLPARYILAPVPSPQELKDFIG